MKKTLNNIVFLIPSLDPDDKMPKYVKALIKAGAKHILLVDDGSKKENKKYFETLSKLKEVIILNHVVNQGKGRGLKTAFNYILDKMKNIDGVVTADADGQHSVEDTINTAYKLLETGTVVFGTRNFNEDIVPFKSRNGNKITTTVFKLLYGKQVNDTQTGLRGLPIGFIKDCLAIQGERFEYEIAMLIKIVQDGWEIVELPIKTIYFDSNRATHFDTFKDSFRIYKIMFSTFIKFTISSLTSALIDILLFTISIATIFKSFDYKVGLLFSTVLARTISCLVNYTLTKKTVFKSNSSVKTSFSRYVVLVILQMLSSWLLVTFIYSFLRCGTTIIKVIVDTLLFFLSYQIQRKWVFINRNDQ